MYDKHAQTWQYSTIDAASCYDRILVNLDMVCARRLGMPVAAILAHSETLRQINYTVKTVDGISEDHYCGTERQSFGWNRSRQRSISSSMAFHMLSYHLCIQSVSPKSMKFSDPTGNIVSTRFVDAFVDDSNTSVGFTSHPKEEQLKPPKMLQLLQDCAQLWQNLLFASGGELELSKCYYYMLHWHWDSQGYPKLSEFSPHLKNLEEHNFGDRNYKALTFFRKRFTLCRNKSAKISSKILGVKIPVNNIWTDEIQRLKKKVTIMRFRPCHINKGI